MNQRTVTAVLLALWRAQEQTSSPQPMEDLLRRTGATLPELQQALSILEQRDCILERTPAGIRLTLTDITCWRDILEDHARRKNLALGNNALIFARTTSTNDIAWQHATAPDSHGLVVIADEQTSGRGRHGHSWLARPGQSILLSVILKKIPAPLMERLTLLAGLATAVAIETALAKTSAGISAEIKWPNDILLDNKKIAGILVEGRPDSPASGETTHTAVIGVGINVNQDPADFPPELRDLATSLRLAGNSAAQLDRVSLAAILIESLSRHCDETCLHEDSWINEWKRRCRLLGKTVKVRSGKQEVTGRVLDIAPLQGLVIRDSAGLTHFFSAHTSSLVQ